MRVAAAIVRNFVTDKEEEFKIGIDETDKVVGVSEDLRELEIRSQSLWIFPRIRSASAVQTKGFGFLLL